MLPQQVPCVVEYQRMAYHFFNFVQNRDYKHEAKKQELHVYEVSQEINGNRPMLYNSLCNVEWSALTAQMKVHLCVEELRESLKKTEDQLGYFFVKELNDKPPDAIEFEEERFLL